MLPSLSTMWLQHRATHLRPWWQQVQALGFRQIELSHIVTSAMLAGLRPGDLAVSSVHFPAPRLPIICRRWPADALISSLNPVLRGWAVLRGRRSIDLAAAWGAKAVCIHAGQVRIPTRLEWVVYQRHVGGQRGTPAYQQALDALLAARDVAAQPYFDAVRRSLQELARYAQQAGVRLGVETRLHTFEIPNLAEAQVLLAEHDPDILGLWYDCGHVQVQANLGMPSQEAWLAACGPRIVAAHLHDTLGLRDHLIPGAGEIDFAALAAALPSAALRVCEFDWYFDGGEVQAGVRHLAACGCCAYFDEGGAS